MYTKYLNAPQTAFSTYSLSKMNLKIFKSYELSRSTEMSSVQKLYLLIRLFTIITVRGLLI